MHLINGFSGKDAINFICQVLFIRSLSPGLCWGSLCAGHDTKAMKNNSGPRYKRSKLERRLNTDVLWSVVLLLVMCLTAAIGMFPHRV